MKKAILLMILLTILAPLFAENGIITFIGGDVTLKDPQGSSYPAQIGMDIIPGVSIITEPGGFAEIEMVSGSKISVNSSTVFTFSEKKDEETRSSKRGIFSCILGSIGFKFKKMVEKEPYIATPATICGIRGTDFTVFAGSDGSALYAVSSGEVAVTAAGTEVSLLSDEGVKVQMGEAPGAKFEVKPDHIDYSELEAEAEAAALADPLGTMERLTAQLKIYSGEAEEWESLWEEAKAIDKQLYDEHKRLKAEGKEDEAHDFLIEKINPTINDSMNTHLNLRHYALSGYSMRRYLATSLYIQMKTKYILDQENEEYLLFLKKYKTFLSLIDEKLIQTEYIYQGDI